jgi:hypothetical protein
LNWNGNPYSSWGVCTRYKPKKRMEIEAPLWGIGSKAISAGEQLMFIREFDGFRSSRTYIELLQKFVHISDIHFVRERSAWCTLNEHGDLVDMARIVELARAETTRGGRAVIVNRRLLDRYAVMTGAVLVRMFDLTHFTPSSFSGWASPREETIVERDGLRYRQWIQPDASYVRGVQIVPPLLTTADMFADFDIGAKRKSQQYASFIAHDWKNDRIAEINCSPDALANYFTKSDKPFETTPAFFRPEVLLKYKADTSKYTVESRSITCHGAWHLKTYDINEEGQVHTYLGYLNRLPYEEQLYWRSFNEVPKGPISKRALTTDFRGEFSYQLDPLEQLKGLLRALVERKVPWWTLRHADLIRQLTAPVTASADEWANDLMTLDKTVVEGLEEKWIGKKAAELGRPLDDRWRSLKALEECLVGLQFEPDHAHSLLSPLHEVHNLRSQQKGHPGGDAARKMREDILGHFGSYGSHFRALCQRCLESLTIIDRALG